MIRAIVFDLDNTLLDRDKSVALFVETQHERLKEALGHIPKQQYVTRFLELEQHGYVWKDKVYQQLEAEFAIENIGWNELLHDYEQEFHHSCIPFPQLTEVLRELKQRELQLGIITNGFGRFQMDNICSLGIDSYFEKIAVSEWEGMKKPDTRLFLNMADQLHVPPAQCVFVGDHPENDVAAAQRAGMRAVLKRSAQFGNADAENVIEDLGELIPLIDRFQSRP